MSLVPLLTHGSKKQNLWVPYFSTGQLNASTISTGNITANTAEISSIVAEYLSTVAIDAEYINNSTINTLHVDLDGQILTATPTELLLNGIPVATQSSLSSIADWSLDPAISTVQMNGNDLDQGGTLSSFNVRAGNGFFLNLVAFNSLFVSTNTSTISSLIESAEVGNFSTLNAGTISSGAISCASVYAPLGEISSLVGDSANFSTVNVSSLTGNSLTFSTLVVSSISSGSIISGADWSNYPAQKSVDMAGFSLQSTSGVSNPSGDLTLTAGTHVYQFSEFVSTVADNGIDVLNKARVSVDAVNGLNGEINMSARPGYGGIGGTVNILAEGGVTPLGVGYGGEVNITATTGGFTTLALTSAVNLNAAGINSYAGAITPVGSVAGYNFIHGDVGVNLTAGAPSFIPSDPLCVYLYGTNGTLMYGTQYIQGPIRPYSDLTTNPADLYIEDYSNLITRGYIQLRGVSTQTFKGGDTAILGVNRIQFSTAGGALENVSSLNGNPLSLYENVSSFNDLFVSSLTVSSINGLGISSLENISTFNTIDASTINTSSISTAIIYGANNNLFGIGIQGLEIQTAPTGQVWISSPQTNIAGLINCSTVGAANVSARNGGISSLGVSSLAASTLTLAGLSSIVFSTSGTAGTQSQPAGRLLIQGNDLDLGQQDLWVQQIRLGAGNPTNAQTEIIFYDAAAGQRGLQTALQDRTLRVVSTINGTTGGYVLDTNINPPFFSTINNTSTALMAFFPSSVNSTIGVSTISIIPVSFQTTSAFSGTLLYPNISSSAVAANVIASTTILTNAAGSYIIAQANTSFQNAGNQYHDIYLNLAIDGVLSPSTFTSLPAGTNHYANGSIAYRAAVSSGTHTLVLYASADANGVAVGSQVDIWGTGNLAP